MRGKDCTRKRRGGAIEALSNGGVNTGQSVLLNFLERGEEAAETISGIWFLKVE